MAKPVPRSGPQRTSEACSNCLNPFIASIIVLDARPPARSFLYPDICNRCAMEIYHKDPTTFSDLLRAKWDLVKGA